MENRSSNFIDLSGKRFGNLEVIGFYGKSSLGEVKFECLCDCGNTTVAYSNNIRRGLTKSCGCQRNRAASKRMSINNPTKRSYKVNENFFSVVDTEEKAYWLGFLGADGNVYYNTIQIALGAKDKNHMDKFLTSIKSEHRYTYREDNNTYFLRVHSKKMVGDLKLLGIVPNKSLIYNPPNINKSLERHFWRGMIDGDGHISINKYGSAVIGLSGTKTACEKFLGFLNRNGIKTNSKPHQKTSENCYQAAVGGNGICPKVCGLLYSGSQIYLDRKFNKAMVIINE